MALGFYKKTKRAKNELVSDVSIVKVEGLFQGSESFKHTMTAVGFKCKLHNVTLKKLLGVQKDENEA